MSRLRSLARLAAGLLVALPLLAAAAAAQDWPAKPVRIIVAFSAGGSNDIVARLVAAKLTERLGKQVLVENRPGGGATIGMEIAATSPPDGYTLFLASIATTVNPWIYKLKHDPLKAFVPVAMLGAGPIVLMVHPSVKARTVKELLELMEKEPGKLNMAHSGIGTLGHLASAMFATSTGAKYVDVPFKGGGPAIIDTVAGHSQMMLGTIVQGIGHIKAGKLVVLGVADKKRHPTLPDVPTFAEAGVADYEVGNFWSIVAPAGTPQSVVDRLHKEITAVQADDQVVKQFEAEGAEVVRMSPPELGAYLAKETAKWEKVVKATGMKAE